MAVSSPQSPLLKTQTITISDVSSALRESAAQRETPFLHSETKTIMYESPQVRLLNMEPPSCCTIVNIQYSTVFQRV